VQPWPEPFQAKQLLSTVVQKAPHQQVQEANQGDRQKELVVKVVEILEECTTDTSRGEYKVKWVGYTNHHNSWVAEEDLHANCLLEQFQESRSSATMDGVRNPRNTEDSVQAGRGR